MWLCHEQEMDEPVLNPVNQQLNGLKTSLKSTCNACMVTSTPGTHTACHEQEMAGRATFFVITLVSC